MKAFTKYTFLVVLSAAFLFTSCEKDGATNPNQDFVSQMKFVADSVIQHANVPGVVALVVDHKKGVDWLYAAGLSDISNQIPMNTNHIFRIGSNTKTMTGTVLLQLVDEGKISLNDKLSAFFPEFPRSDEITIAMLSNMTSGIFNYTDDESWNNELDQNPTRVWKPEELLDIAFSHNFNFTPGTDWRYSNSNTIILGMVIEKVTGNSLQSEVENRILKPLNLLNTALQTSGTGLPAPHGRGYVLDDGESKFADVTTNFDVSFVWAAGSAYSTPRELQKYVETLVEGGFLSNSLQNKRLAELHSLDAKNAYGYAILKRGSFFGHNGALPGYTSSMYHSKEKDCTIIIYFNCLTDLHPDFLFYRFVDILYGSNF